MSETAAILGAGLSALFAYSACNDLGIETTIITDKIGKAPAGRTYIRWVPPRLSNKIEPEPMLMMSIGSRQVYLERLERPHDYKTAFPDGQQIHRGYNPDKVFDLLLPGRDNITDVGRKLSDQDIKDFASRYTYVFLTFPTEEAKKVQPPLIRYRVLVAEPTDPGYYPNFVLYNGTHQYWWTRWSHMYGVSTWEFSDAEFPNPDLLPEAPSNAQYESTLEFAPGTTPWDDIRVPAPNVCCIGRWAQWSKDVLSHHSYARAARFITRRRLMK